MACIQFFVLSSLRLISLLLVLKARGDARALGGLTLVSVELWQRCPDLVAAGAAPGKERLGPEVC
jgi:hypothetical protein